LIEENQYLREGAIREIGSLLGFDLELSTHPGSVERRHEVSAAFPGVTAILAS